MKWMDEKVPHIESGNWLYNIICFMTGKRKEKMSYKEIYAFMYELNRKKLGEDESIKKATIRSLDIYKYHHNGNLPEMAELGEDDE